MYSQSALADIFQWYDGDGDGSLWLSNASVAPYSDFSMQTLWWADLPFANLHHGDFIFTNFSYADLSGANLSSVDMSYTDLQHANLENADLTFTLFVGTDLASSNMSGANIFYADFSDANLSNIENWGSAFWLAARYNENTIFPDGMDPNDFGMIEIVIPAPEMLCFVGFSILLPRRRR